MNDNKSLRILYTVFLGVLMALFVGVGIATFYVAPEQPVYPNDISAPEATDFTGERARQIEYDRQYETYQLEQSDYNRNVSIISLIIAVALIVGGLISERRIKMLADAIMLGGIFTLLYSIGRGFAADDNRHVFLVLTVSLVVIVYLGYSRFVRPSGASVKAPK